MKWLSGMLALETRAGQREIIDLLIADEEARMAQLSIDVRGGSVRVFSDGDPIEDCDAVRFEWRRGSTPILCVERPHSAALTRACSGSIEMPGVVLVREPAPDLRRDDR